MVRYHSEDYINFLRNIKPDNMHEFVKQKQRCEFCVYILFERVFAFLCAN